MPVNDDITEPTSEPTSTPGEQSNDDVVKCAALGCPGNPPNPHGPPTEERRWIKMRIAMIGLRNGINFEIS